MTIKGFAAAQRHKGGFDKWVYEMIVALSNGETSDSTAINEIKAAIGKASGEGAGGILKDVKDVKDAIGTETTADTILYRIKALETAAANSGSGGSGSGGSGSS